MPRRPGWRPAGIGLCLTLAALAAAAAARDGGGVEPRSDRLAIEVFRTGPVEDFGYRIRSGERTLVHQPHVPAVPGTDGFALDFTSSNRVGD